MWFLALAKELDGQMIAKSSPMLGLGESFEEVLQGGHPQHRPVPAAEPNAAAGAEILASFRVRTAQGDCSAKGVPAL
jgi:hypothetical protein